MAEGLPPTSRPLAQEARRCRRCGGVFVLPAEPMRFASCPHCGKAVEPLGRRLRDNRLAALLALLGIGVLTAGILVPFVAMEQMGRQRAYSLLGGIGELFSRGYVVLGLILLIFSVIFPYAKLLALLVATSALLRLGGRTRHRLHILAVLTGRYSLLDILVVAVMIVVIRFDGLVEVRALPGTVLFAAAVLLSIAAGLCVRLPPEEEPAHG